MVRLDPILEEPANGEVVNAEHLYLLRGKVLRRLMRNIDKILHEIIGLPTASRVPRLEKNSLAALNLM